MCQKLNHRIVLLSYFRVCSIMEVNGGIKIESFIKALSSDVTFLIEVQSSCLGAFSACPLLHLGKELK